MRCDAKSKAILRETPPSCTWRRARKRGEVAANPTCLACGVALVAHDNWRVYPNRKPHYRCTPCFRAWTASRATRPQRRYSTLLYQAKLRGIPVRLGFTTYKRLVTSPCGYCGGPLAPFGSGLDRIDNARGYVKSNVIPACGPCHGLRGLCAKGLTVEETRAIVWQRRARALSDLLQGSPISACSGPASSWASLRQRGHRARSAFPAPPPPRANQREQVSRRSRARLIRRGSTS